MVRPLHRRLGTWCGRDTPGVWEAEAGVSGGATGQCCSEHAGSGVVVVVDFATLIKGFARPQSDGAVEDCDLVRHGRVPPELCKAAQHALGYLSPITTAPYLVWPRPNLCGRKPGSRGCYGDEVASFYDWHTAPDDLRLVIDADIDIREPDTLATWMRANLDNSPHHHAPCCHKAKR